MCSAHFILHNPHLLRLLTPRKSFPPRIHHVGTKTTIYQQISCTLRLPSCTAPRFGFISGVVRAGSPRRRIKRIFASGRPSPRLSELLLFVSARGLGFNPSLKSPMTREVFFSLHELKLAITNHHKGTYYTNFFYFSLHGGPALF